MRALALTLLMSAGMTTGAAAQNFRFEQYPSLEEMRAFLADAAPSGSARSVLEQIMIAEGGAHRFLHPHRPGVEKYVYVINLCRIYVWEWNISADYDEDGLLTEVYVNGEPVHDDSHKAVPTAADGGDEAGGTEVAMMSLPRPEADLGESAISFVVAAPGRIETPLVDQLTMVGGPSRADPTNLGNLHGYVSEYWRSIVDASPVPVVDYSGECAPGVAP